MWMISKTSIMMSIITPFMKHPISMGFMLIMQTISVSTMMAMKSNSSWYSYILFITIIGGMMIMFMYMSSIASNEKFKMNNILLIVTIIMFTMMMTKLINDKTMEMFNNMEMNKMNLMKKEEIKSTSKFFNLNKMKITMIMMMILLLTMVSVTNISNSFEGPLKKTYV